MPLYIATKVQPGRHRLGTFTKRSDQEVMAKFTK